MKTLSFDLLTSLVYRGLRTSLEFVFRFLYTIVHVLQMDVIFDVIGTPCWKDIESVPSEHWRAYLKKVPGRVRSCLYCHKLMICTLSLGMQVEKMLSFLWFIKSLKPEYMLKIALPCLQVYWRMHAVFLNFTWLPTIFVVLCTIFSWLMHRKQLKFFRQEYRRATLVSYKFHSTSSIDPD
jgi:hypothetical protein